MTEQIGENTFPHFVERGKPLVKRSVCYQKSLKDELGVSSVKMRKFAPLALRSWRADVITKRKVNGVYVSRCPGGSPGLR